MHNVTQRESSPNPQEHPMAYRTIKTYTAFSGDYRVTSNGKTVHIQHRAAGTRKFCTFYVMTMKDWKKYTETYGIVFPYLWWLSLIQKHNSEGQREKTLALFFGMHVALHCVPGEHCTAPPALRSDLRRHTLSAHCPHIVKVHCKLQCHYNVKIQCHYIIITM